MKTYTAFLRWCIYFNLICVGLVILYFFDIFQMLYEADITKISFFIIFLFFIFTIRAGIDTFRINKYMKEYHEDINRSKQGLIKQIKEQYQKNEVRWFIAGVFTKLGMLGTVIGLVYVLNKSFINVDFSNVDTMKNTISIMAQGMGTALYTTATGLIFRILLDMQSFNIEQVLDRLKNAKVV